MQTYHKISYKNTIHIIHTHRVYDTDTLYRHSIRRTITLYISYIGTITLYISQETAAALRSGHPIYIIDTDTLFVVQSPYIYHMHIQIYHTYIQTYIIYMTIYVIHISYVYHI